MPQLPSSPGWRTCSRRILTPDSAAIWPGEIVTSAATDEAAETRHSIVGRGLTRHRVATSSCFAAAETTRSRLSVKGGRSSGDFWLLRRRRGPAAPRPRVQGVRVGGVAGRGLAGPARPPHSAPFPSFDGFHSLVRLGQLRSPSFDGFHGPDQRGPHRFPTQVGFRSPDQRGPHRFRLRSGSVTRAASRRRPSTPTHA